MAITLSTGVTLAVAKTYALPLAFTAATNNAECTLTVTGSTIVAGDWVEISSGWDLLDKRVVRTKAGTNATAIVLEGVNTENTSRFPSGTGAGSVRKIMAWSQLSQVKSLSASGGEQQFADITSISDTVSKQMPTMRGAMNMTVDCYDDPALPWYADVIKADEARAPYGLLMQFPNGSKLGANAYWSLMRVPSVTQNEALMTQVTLSYAAEPIRYAA